MGSKIVSLKVTRKLSRLKEKSLIAPKANSGRSESRRSRFLRRPHTWLRAIHRPSHKSFRDRPVDDLGGKIDWIWNRYANCAWDGEPI